ncbi:MAG: hypothetical protein NT112_04380 [Methanoregula sp.]|nr:hypothetical protein [Methanoregula sp.]
MTGVASVEFCGVWDIEGLMITAGDSIGVATGWLGKIMGYSTNTVRKSKIRAITVLSMFHGVY